MANDTPLSPVQSIPRINPDVIDFLPCYDRDVTKHHCTQHGTSSPRTKELVWAMFDGRCYYCGIQTNPFSTFSIDHKVPKSRGGTDCLYNLVPCCRRCNSSKGARMTVIEWWPFEFWFCTDDFIRYDRRWTSVLDLCCCWEDIEIPEEWLVSS